MWGELGRYPRRAEAMQHRRLAEEEARASYNTRLEARKTNRSERDRTSVNLCIEKDERKRSNIEEIKTTIVSSLGDRNPTIKEKDISTSTDQDHGVKAVVSRLKRILRPETALPRLWCVRRDIKAAGSRPQY